MSAHTVSFAGIVIAVGPGALVPRLETELLATAALAKLVGVAAPRVVDVCCGTGNLACAIASARSDARVWACDLTAGAVVLARANVASLSLGGRVSVAQGDLFAPLAGDLLDGTIDAIVCNPPYISTGKLAGRPDLANEPREAFDGGPYGLTIHQRVIREGVGLLRPGGVLLFEFGVGQGRQLELLFKRAGGYRAVTMAHDSAGVPRVAMAHRRG